MHVQCQKIVFQPYLHGYISEMILDNNYEEINWKYVIYRCTVDNLKGTLHSKLGQIKNPTANFEWSVLLSNLQFNDHS